MFFFADYAGQREVRGLDYPNTVPTDAVRSGDFSNFRNASTGALIQVWNPYTTRVNPANPSGFIRDPFPNNTIPGSLIGQTSRNVASIYPAPNLPGNFLNYQSAPVRTIKDNQYTVRTDFQAS